MRTPPTVSEPSSLRTPEHASEPFLDDPDVTIHQGDVLDVLPRLARGQRAFDAVVTSPPYLDARDDVRSFSHVAYLGWAEGWLSALADVLDPAGSMMLNVGRIHRDGVEIRWGNALLAIAVDLGWKILDEIVWYKVNGGGGRSSPYLIDRHEYVYWLARSTKPYKGFDDARVPYSPDTLARYRRRWKSSGSAVKGKDGEEQDGRTPHPGGAKPGSVFVSSVGVEKGTGHPTPMTLDLAEFLVKLSCPPDGVVLDPFAGSGTTLLAAKRLGRRSVGIEIEERWCEEAAGRVGAQQSLLSLP